MVVVVSLVVRAGVTVGVGVGVLAAALLGAVTAVSLRGCRRGWLLPGLGCWRIGAIHDVCPDVLAR